MDKFLAGVSWWVLFPVRMLVAAPLIDGFGTSAWDNMLRRTQLLIHSPSEFTGCQHSEAQGDLALVLQRLAPEITSPGKKWEILLVGHSMGTIILNELIRQFPSLEYSTIVYMAAACSSRDFQQSVIPYLQAHSATQFYNLTLHHIAEERERWDLYVPYFDPAMRGSLLTWIDDFLFNPLTPMDKTMGQFVNFLRTEQMFSHELRGQIHLREFSVGGVAAGKEPQVHGDFNDFPFWEEKLYTPQPHRQ